MMPILSYTSKDSRPEKITRNCKFISNSSTPWKQRHSDGIVRGIYFQKEKNFNNKLIIVTVLFMRESDFCFRFVFIKAGGRRRRWHSTGAAKGNELRAYFQNACRKKAFGPECASAVKWKQMLHKLGFFFHCQRLDFIENSQVESKYYKRSVHPPFKINLLTPTECCAYFIRFQWKTWLLNNVTQSKGGNRQQTEWTQEKKQYSHFFICITISTEHIHTSGAFIRFNQLSATLEIVFKSTGEHKSTHLSKGWCMVRFMNNASPFGMHIVIWADWTIKPTKWWSLARRTAQKK